MGFSEQNDNISSQPKISYSWSFSPSKLAISGFFKLRPGEKKLVTSGRKWRKDRDTVNERNSVYTREFAIALGIPCICAITKGLFLFKNMLNRCVVFGFPNEASREYGVSMHLIPFGNDDRLEAKKCINGKYFSLAQKLPFHLSLQRYFS